MDSIMLIVIIMGGLMFLGLCALILLYYLLWFRKRTVLHVLTADLKFINTTYKKIPDTVCENVKDGSKNGGTYFYRHDKAIKTQWGTHSYYYQGIPEPIDFSKKEQVPIPNLMAGDLERILKSDFITKLFAGQRLEETIMILQIITLFLCIVIIIVLLVKSPSKYVELDTSSNTTFNMIRQACRGI